MAITGSKFLPEVVACSNYLMDLIKYKDVLSKIKQHNGNFAFSYAFDWNVGDDGICKIHELALEEQNRIEHEERNGITVHILYREKLPLTNTFTLIVNAFNEIVTAFPNYPIEDKKQYEQFRFSS